MNESKKMLIVVGVVVFAVLGIFGFALTESKASEKMYNDFEAAFNGNKNKLVYIGSSTCGYCQLLNPSLEDMKERYQFDYLYIDAAEISSGYLKKILAKLELSSLGTPYLAVVSNGKVVDTQNGYSDYDITFEFLQDNKIIAEDQELLLNYIDYEEYEKLLKSDEKNVIVVGQSTCSYCVQAKITLNEIVEENDITINYLNISYLTEEEGEKFESSLDYFEDSWGTPIMMIVKDGKIVDIIEQYVEKDEYVEFLEENGVIE